MSYLKEYADKLTTADASGQGDQIRRLDRLRLDLRHRGRPGRGPGQAHA